MNYFIQTQPSPNEGPHAQEVTAEEFHLACNEHTRAWIEWVGESVYLRLDEPDRDHHFIDSFYPGDPS